MYNNISIIGDGAMATVMAGLLCEKGLNVKMWGHDSQQLKEIQETSENLKFLPGYPMPEKLNYQSDDEKIMQNADLILSAVPCQYTRSVWERLKPYYPEDVSIVTVTKGIENKTLMRPAQILRDILGKDTKIVALSGPTIADELARRLPAVACSACEDAELAKEVQYTFNTKWFRVYTNKDITGVELAGATKNVIAIAAGIIDGMKVGDNTKAALLSRGLAEITRLGIACGADEHTFSGITGMGDLVTTCISPKGRNRSFGERIGKGMSLEDAKNATQSVVEGIATCQSVYQLAKSKNVEMPITEAVYQVLFEDKPLNRAMADLMTRQLKAEFQF